MICSREEARASTKAVPAPAGPMDKGCSLIQIPKAAAGVASHGMAAAGMIGRIDHGTKRRTISIGTSLMTTIGMTTIGEGTKRRNG